MSSKAAGKKAIKPREKSRKFSTTPSSAIQNPPQIRPPVKMMTAQAASDSRQSAKYSQLASSARKTNLSRKYVELAKQMALPLECSTSKVLPSRGTQQVCSRVIKKAYSVTQSNVLNGNISIILNPDLASPAYISDSGATVIPVVAGPVVGMLDSMVGSSAASTGTVNGIGTINDALGSQ